MKIVPPLDARRGGSLEAEDEPVARGGKRVSRCSFPVCERFCIYFVGKLHSCHDSFCP